MMFKNKLKSSYIWTFTIYFSQGFPFSIIRTVFPVFLRDIKVSLESIGLTSLFGLPWVLKFLWGPQIDKTHTKKKWLTSLGFIIGSIILFSSFLIPLEKAYLYLAVIFFILAFFAATNDIAIDAYYMIALDKVHQAKYIGLRVMAYRIAMIVGTGVIVTIGTTFSWVLAFFIAGLIMCLVSVFHFFILDDAEKNQVSILFLIESFFKIKNFIVLIFISLIIFGLRTFLNSNTYINLSKHYSFLAKLNFSHIVSLTLLLGLIVLFFFRKKIKNLLNNDSFYSKAFLTYIDRPSITLILSFIILLRTGEWMLSTMLAPFIVDLGIKAHYGWLASGVGLPASINGAIFGGYLISKYGLKKVIWPFILAQNLTNVIYAILAYTLQTYISINTGVDNPNSIGFFNLFMVASVMAFDQFSGGLGTSVLTIFLINLCVNEYKATHYAIGSGLMSITGMFAGVLSGIFASKFGYASTFLISFLFSVPAMLLIPFLPDLKKQTIK